MKAVKDTLLKLLGPKVVQLQALRDVATYFGNQEDLLPRESKQTHPRESSPMGRNNLLLSNYQVICADIRLGRLG